MCIAWNIDANMEIGQIRVFNFPVSLNTCPHVRDRMAVHKVCRVLITHVASKVQNTQKTKALSH